MLENINVHNLQSEIAVGGRTLDEKHPETLQSIRALIGLYEACGKPEEAEEWQARLPQTEAAEK